MLVGNIAFDLVLEIEEIHMKIINVSVCRNMSEVIMYAFVYCCCLNIKMQME